MHRRTLLSLLAASAAVTGLPRGPLAADGAALSPLVGVDWLRANLGRDDLVVVDIRGEERADAYAAGHVPGAIWSAYPGGWRGVGAVPGSAPDAAALESLIGGLGIGNGTVVVIVPDGEDATAFGGATRVYWSLKYAGLDDVAILDGGWPAWRADPANPVATAPTTPSPAAFTARLRPDLLVSTEEVVARLETDTVLMDGRAVEQFIGEKKSLASRRAGHIPGSVNVDNALLYDAAAQRLKPREDLARILRATVSDTEAQIITYCNAGHWSATNWFVLHELLGYENSALYVDSMPGWTADDSRPVAR